MARQRRAIHKKSVATHMAVVPHVRRSQKKILIAYRGFPTTTNRAPADGHVFAKRISVANLELRFFASKAKVLRVAANKTSFIDLAQKTLADELMRRNLTAPQVVPAAGVGSGRTALNVFSRLAKRLGGVFRR